MTCFSIDMELVEIVLFLIKNENLSPEQTTKKKGIMHLVVLKSSSSSKQLIANVVEQIDYIIIILSGVYQINLKRFTFHHSIYVRSFMFYVA